MGMRSYSYMAANSPRISHIKGVQAQLDLYDIRIPIQIDSDENGKCGILRVPFESDTLYSLTAVRIDELPNEESEDDLDNIHRESGNKGLRELLRSLVPFLESSFVLQAAYFDSAGGFFSAEEWVVKPDTSDVEIKEIIAMEGEDVMRITDAD